MKCAARNKFEECVKIPKLIANLSKLSIIKMKHFYLNGQTYSTSYSLRLSDLITYFNYNKSLLVLEYNDVICNKKNWDRIYIKNLDKIEIVTIVGGG